MRPTTFAWSLLVLLTTAGCKDPLKVSPARDLPALAAPGEGPSPAPAPKDPEVPSTDEIVPVSGPSPSADPQANPPPRSRGHRARGDRARGEAAPGPAAAADHSGAELKVTRFVVSRGVSGREPVGAASTFDAGEIDKLYAFVELSNEARAESEVFVTFTAPSGKVTRLKLEVGAEKRWRTWAFTRKPRTPGAWTAVLSTADGRELARTSFTVR